MSLLFGGGAHITENLFHNIVSVSNLFRAWNEFKKGKRKKKDVAEFELHLEDNIFRLHEELVSKRYCHNTYSGFYVSDPKRRHIHKATVRDRVVHQAIYRILSPIFDRHFIYDSYSSRKSRGTHLGVERVFKAFRKESKNWKIKVYALKCDVRKFFDSIDHAVLRNLIKRKIACLDTMDLINLLFQSFEKEKDKGLPLGNVTSQLFTNIYLNEFDQFVKHRLRIKYYFRYCDDFVMIHEDGQYLKNLIPQIRIFLHGYLALDLHPHKVEIRSLRQGVDFLGYVSLPYVTVLRTRTKNRILRKINLIHKKLKANVISEEAFKSTLISYRGVVLHCRNRKLEMCIKRFL